MKFKQFFRINFNLKSQRHLSWKLIARKVEKCGKFNCKSWIFFCRNYDTQIPLLLGISGNFLNGFYRKIACINYGGVFFSWTFQSIFQKGNFKGLETFQGLLVNIFRNTSYLKPTVLKIEWSCGNFSVGQWFESKKYRNFVGRIFFYSIIYFIFHQLFNF